MNISEIKYRTQEKQPYFFERKTLKFFGQKMKDFKVYKQKDGRYQIIAPMYAGQGGHQVGYTERFFNPATNDLEHK